MCLAVLDINKEPQIAQENIVVYKRLERTGKGEYMSPFIGYKYKRNQLYKAKIGRILGGKRQFPQTCMDYNMNKKITVIGVIHQGIHAYISRATAITKSDDWFDEEESVITCIIPKGSQYYLGAGNEIVTNQLFIGTKIK